ncbi:hypothetical protein AJ78_07207 [Emergomyces pasteurianus Ep9510]|uniref:Ubiquitin-conjugating enzyme E2C-binding protein n=1 Tax=Emergomyces pasteurianus Ep9510 TaxID=1447872 RepID=A0A1J9P7S0_9EURO|nr:hypothetical protein AJ78_07207 [Emergomyces pasteurianus Ep9510]
MPFRAGSVPLLYAELLPNIRQITLHVSLPDFSSFAQDSITSTSRTPVNLNLPSGIYSLSLLPSRRAVRLSTPDTVRTLNLPALVSESAHNILATLPTPTPSGTGHGELLFRLPVEAEAGLPGISQTTSGQPGHDNNELQVPWTAKDMCSESRIRCRHCKSVFFIPSKGGEVVWKDLPSHDWAEMMDLWHCHKPDTHPDEHGDTADDPVFHAHDVNETTKGYGAANQVICSSGTVLIDILSFVMAEEDCQGLEKSGSRASDYLVLAPTRARSIVMKGVGSSLFLMPSLLTGRCGSLQKLPPSSPLPSIGNRDEFASQPVVDLSCSFCGAPVGEEHATHSGLRLYKANVSLLRKPKDCINHDNDVWETFPVDMIVGTQLLELAERIGTRRFAVHSTEYTGTNRRDNKGGLLLWVFNPDLRYSSSPSDSAAGDEASVTSQRAMKIFYQEVPDIQSILNPAQGAPAPTTLEDVCLPLNIYEGIKQTLERSGDILPVSARQFREWRVGLFSRFEQMG